jgi:hypothetical protein
MQIAALVSSPVPRLVQGHFHISFILYKSFILYCFNSLIKFDVIGDALNDYVKIAKLYSIFDLNSVEITR